MKNYLITYDLKVPGHDYNVLYAEITRYPYIHALESVWFVRSNGSASSIAKELIQYIDTNDKLFVSEVTIDRAGWFGKEVEDFLRR